MLVEYTSDPLVVRRVAELFAGLERQGWRLDFDQRRCVEAVDDRHSYGMRLTATDFPNYFAALAADRSIAAHDAST